MLLALPAPAMALSISGPTAVSEGSGNATYEVTCGSALEVIAVSVTAGPAPAATEGDDFTSQTLLPHACLLAGDAFTFDVTVVNDESDENGEQFTVTAAYLTDSQSVTTTITDDDPVASIDEIFLLTEGDSGTSTADLTVKLASAAVQPTTIGYSTEDWSAVAGQDYVATSGSLVIPVGQMSGTISIPVIGDMTAEQPEAFYLNLLTTDNGSLSPTQRQAAVGIWDTDTGGLPSVSLAQNPVSVEEGDRGTGNVLFKVTLSSAATQRTEVGWKTVDWTANKGDYESASGKVVFQAGQRSKTISVDVKGDRRDEPDEAFGVTLQNPVAATLGRKDGLGVIEDDDGPKMRIGKPRLRDKRLMTKVGCPESADGCKGRLVGKSGGLKLGRKKFALGPGDERKLRLKLSPAEREALAENRRRTKLIATASDLTGDTRVTKRKARLRRLG